MTIEEITSQIKQAEQCITDKNYAEAERLTEPILEHEIVIQNAVLNIRVLNAFVESLWQQGRLKNALPYAEQAVNMAGLLVVGNELYLANAYNNIGIVNFSISDYPKALEYYSQALDINEQIGNKNGIASNLGNIGSVYFNLSDFPQALDNQNKALKINEQIGNKNGIAPNLGNIGNVYFALSDYSHALEYYTQALEINEQMGDKNRIAINLGNIGSVYSCLKDYPKTLEYLSKALNIYKQIGNKNGIALNLGNIGTVYTDIADYNKALEYFNKALDLNELLRRKSGIAINLGNIGGVYKMLNEYDKAYEYLQKALSLSEEIGYSHYRLHCFKTLGELFAEERYEKKEPIKAEEYLLNALHGSIELGLKNLSKEACESLAKLYQKQEQWKEAFEMKVKQAEIEMEINVEEAKKQADKLAYERRQNEREKEIAVERATAQAKQEASDNLLNKVLPHQIATRMLSGEKEIADYYPAVSILFADIQGFTPLTADMPAYMLVRMLNHIFSRFDEIIKEHGCTKIKTIGDGYMAVAGAPDATEDHAERIAAVGLQMLHSLEIPAEIEPFLPTGAALKIRVGVHTGHIVAGVVGQDKFMYDIYSDAVNTASRMESHGEPDKVHVSSDFMRHLLNRFAMTKNTQHGYSFENRGEMDIKGKGKMKTYFLKRLS